MNEVENAIRILKDNGYKYTDKRKQILNYFDQENRYSSAKEVQKNLKITFPNISYDTIYRNLYTFVDLEIVEETELNGEKLFRLSCSHSGHHHHFICTICGKTKAIEMCPMNFFENQLEGYQIESHRFEIFGTCEACAKQSATV